VKFSCVSLTITEVPNKRHLNDSGVFVPPVFIPELVPGVDVTVTADWLAGWGRSEPWCINICALPCGFGSKDCLAKE
jgi:hypothetical protein